VQPARGEGADVQDERGKLPQILSSGTSGWRSVRPGVRRRRGPVALRPRLSPGVPLSIGIGLGCDTVRRGTHAVKSGRRRVRPVRVGVHSVPATVRRGPTLASPR
jgi:hypothetical protein